MPHDERALYIISVAADLAGVHPQTLRIYERKGLIEPMRTQGRSRRYSERDVALLMLKGLSHREIAIARDTSERTIRQQAQAIYAKANLSGRAALSAFFLEDLLLPREQN